MTTETHHPTALSATELALGLANKEPVTILDVREEADWPIEAAEATVLHTPARVVLDDPDQAAARLDGPVVVVCNRGIMAEQVTDALRPLGVEARPLEGGMRAWTGVLQARPVDLPVDGLSAWQVQRPGRGCLSYILIAGGEALVVDPAPDTDFYVRLVAAEGARITRVFDTHVHADHLSGARKLAKETDAILHLPLPALDRGVGYADEVVPLSDGDELQLGGVGLRAIALPGHTSDMTGLVIADKALIGGDSLFADGIARPDLQHGDPEGARAMARTLHSTLHERALPLGDQVVLLPGHTHPGVRAAAIAPTLAEVRAAVSELTVEDAGEFAERLLADMPPRPANYETVIAVNSGHHPFDPELETGGNSCSTR